jgi:CHAT domain-containing protein/Tfp pilus assembly protein PilF
MSVKLHSLSIDYAVPGHPMMPVRRIVRTTSFRLAASSLIILISASSLFPQEFDPQAKSILKRGVVVESVGKTSEAAKSGLREGDLILKWQQGNLSGLIASPYDLAVVETERRLRGPVVLEGRSKGKVQTWVLRSGLWQLGTRPALSGVVLSAYLQARNFARLGKWTYAIAGFEAVERYVPSSQFPAVLSWIDSQKAEALFRAHEFDESGRAFEKAIDEAKQVAPLFASNLLIGWGDLLAAHGNFTEAESLYDRSWQASRNVDSGTLTTAVSLGRIGWANFFRGDLASAQSHSERALEILKKFAPKSLEFTFELSQAGALQLFYGNLAEAERYDSLALAILKRSYPTETNVAAGNVIMLANVAFERGDLAKAEAEYLQALALGRQGTPVTMDVAVCLIGLGGVARQQRHLRRAETLYRSALAIQQKAGLTTRNLAVTFAGLGDVSLDRLDLASAENYYRQELATYKKTWPISLDVAESLNHLGDVSRQTGNLKQADDYYRQSLAIQDKTAPGTRIQPQSLAGIARNMRRKGDLDGAASYFKNALSVIESQTARLGGSPETRAGFRATNEDLYREYFDLLLTQHKPEIAFEILERSRARTLLEMLATAKVDIRKGVDSELLERERSLQADIRAKSERRIRLLNEKQADELKAAEQVKALEKEISDLTSAYQDVEGQIRSSSPSYAALTQPQPLSAAQIQQQLLDQDTLLLEYSLGEERSHVFAVTPDSLQAFDLPGRAAIERASRRVYALLTTPDHGVRGETSVQRKQRQRQNEDAFPQAAAELSRMVLGPVAKQLAGKRLLIVADGALQYIPFAVLADPEGALHTAPASAGAKSYIPLIVNHEIVNLPSASVLAVLRQQERNRSTAPKSVAVLADPVFNRQDPRVAIPVKVASARPDTVRGTPHAGVTDDLLAGPSSVGLLTRSAADVGLGRNGRLDLPRLRFSRQEADSILAFTPGGQGMEALDFKANRAAAMDPALSQYRIVHFATHGLLNSEHPELSGLVFSLVDRHGKPQDGFLGLEDIYNLNLPADLVVLSSCETALGKEISGEGLVGLTRGFMYAGATRVVASLWKVSDVATARLMADFYRAMEHDGLRPAAALRSAQVQMWKQKRWSSPYFWAAFQIQGEWR